MMVRVNLASHAPYQVCPGAQSITRGLLNCPKSGLSVNCLWSPAGRAEVPQNREFQVLSFLTRYSLKPAAMHSPPGACRRFKALCTLMKAKVFVAFVDLCIYATAPSVHFGLLKSLIYRTLPVDSRPQMSAVLFIAV